MLPVCSHTNKKKNCDTEEVLAQKFDFFMWSVIALAVCYWDSLALDIIWIIFTVFLSPGNYGSAGLLPFFIRNEAEVNLLCVGNGPAAALVLQQQPGACSTLGTAAAWGLQQQPGACSTLGPAASPWVLQHPGTCSISLGPAVSPWVLQHPGSCSTMGPAAWHFMLTLWRKWQFLADSKLRIMIP